MHTEWFDFLVNGKMERVHFSSLNLGTKSRNPIVGNHGYYDSVELETNEGSMELNRQELTTDTRISVSMERKI